MSNPLNLQRRSGGFDALREFIGDMLGNDAILSWEHDALLALVDNLARQSPTTAQDRQKHGVHPMTPPHPSRSAFAQLVDDAREFCAALDEGRDEDALTMLHREPYNEPVARGRLLRAAAALSR